MHTIVVVSESENADNGLIKQLQMLFPDCRIKILHKTNETTDKIDGKPVWSSNFQKRQKKS